MTLEEYKALIAKAAEGDQQALIDLGKEGERLYSVESNTAEATRSLAEERDKLRQTNTQLLVSMFGRSDPSSPAGVVPKEEIPDLYDENGFRLHGVEYAVALAEKHAEQNMKEDDNGN